MNCEGVKMLSCEDVKSVLWFTINSYCVIISPQAKAIYKIHIISLVEDEQEKKINKIYQISRSEAEQEKK